ncbi:hypothetical protein GJ744_006674 [Endocarpon pusillum]|uniref:Cation efflux protein transmembrane domain-containing protein n=1 Tax=Endocarpon pusillum TaxID=364733 RepID=A0A8H7ASL1_9EURO|nr:hypothetical protein GJ744_006674 [Endocarpon pusillum]
MVGKRSLTNVFKPDSPPNGDIEHGLQKPKFARFRDVVDMVNAQNQRKKIKNQLTEGVDRMDLEKYRKSDEDLKSIKSKRVRNFYKSQNERLDAWLEVDTLVMTMAEDILESMNPDRDRDGIPEHDGALQGVGERLQELLPKEAREERLRGEKHAKWAINVNVIANILLLAAKCMAASYSSSLSLIASLIDSALDLLCTVIVWTTNRLVQWQISRLSRQFPVGRRRLEPIGILVFSVIMVIAFVQVLQESMEKLLPGGEKKAAALPLIAAGAMGGTVIVKGIIWFGCIRIKTTQVQALAQDCKTDVVFNTLSLLFPLLGHRLSVWWLDPVGAAILSLFIIYDWTATSLENVTRLSGSAVSKAIQQKLTFLAYRFAPVVDGIKSITAYHAGDKAWVEYDILLPEKMPLASAHDIAETLQYCCEGLDEVDRAFVTTDYASHGPTGHATDHV